MSPSRRARTAGVIVLMGAALCWLSGARAFAQTSALEASTYPLSWVRDEGAESCITSARLALALEELVGPVLRSASEADRSIEGLVRHDPRSRRWHVRIRVLDRRGSELGMRRLDREASDCAQLDRSILLVTALAVAPAEGHALHKTLARFALEEEPGPLLLRELEQHPPTPVLPKSAAPSIIAAGPAPPSHEPALMFAGELSFAVAAEFGLLPTTRPGARLVGRLRAPWRLSLSAALQYWSRSEVASYADDSAAFRAVDGTLSLCAAPLAEARFTLDLCGGSVVGARLASAEASGSSNNPTQAYWGPNLSAELSIRLAARWFVLLSAAGSALWPRDRFIYADPSGRSFTIFHPSRLSGSVALGAGVRL